MYSFNEKKIPKLIAFEAVWHNYEEKQIIVFNVQY